MKIKLLAPTNRNVSHSHISGTNKVFTHQELCPLLLACHFKVTLDNNYLQYLYTLCIYETVLLDQQQRLATVLFVTFDHVGHCWS